MAFAITEPDAGSNAHKLKTNVRRDGDEWVLNGGKYYISGVDEVDAVLVVARASETGPGAGDRADGRARLHVPADRDGPACRRRSSSRCFFDDVRLPVGRAGGLARTRGCRSCSPGSTRNGSWPRPSPPAWPAGRWTRRPTYARTRTVWDTPIGAHQGLAHPLAQCAIQVELARLMTQKAAALYDAGEDKEAGEAANMAKYAAGEAIAAAVDQAIQVHGGNGLSAEFGLACDAGRVPVVPNRPGQPGNDPQLRRAAHPEAAALLLNELGQIPYASTLFRMRELARQDIFDISE